MTAGAAPWWMVVEHDEGVFYVESADERVGPYSKAEAELKAERLNGVSVRSGLEAALAQEEGMRQGLTARCNELEAENALLRDARAPWWKRLAWFANWPLRIWPARWTP